MKSQNLKIYWDKINVKDALGLFNYIDTLNDEELKEFSDKMLDDYFTYDDNGKVHYPKMCGYFIKYLGTKMCKLYDIQKEDLEHKTEKEFNKHLSNLKKKFIRKCYFNSIKIKIKEIFK